MRTYVFVFNDDHPETSFIIEAKTKKEAIEKLAANMDHKIYSDLPSDYQEDINTGAISVYAPTKLGE